jgi:hypothetical protein
VKDRILDHYRSELLAGTSPYAASLLMLVGKGPWTGNPGGGGGGPPPSEPEAVTTHTVRNQSGSTVTNAYFQVGQGFKRGEVPSTHKLVLGDIEFQPDDIAYWDDGSIQHCVLTGFIPSIPASSAFSLAVQKQSGSYTPSGLRSIADITAHDLKVVLTDVRGYDNVLEGSGSFTFAVNDWINDSSRVRKYKTGAVSDAWEVFGFAKDNTGGAAHAHLCGRWFIEVVTDPSNPSLVWGIKYIVEMQAGFIAVAGAQSYTYKAALYDGAVLVNDFTETWSFASTAINTTTKRITLADHGLKMAECVVFTSTGSLPTPVVANRPYFVRVIDANTFELYLTPDGVFAGGATTTNPRNVTAIDATADTVTLAATLNQFEICCYSAGGSSPMPNFTVGNCYYAKQVSGGIYQFYDTRANAVAGGTTGRVDVTGIGTGTQTFAQDARLPFSTQGSGTITLTKKIFHPYWTGIALADEDAREFWTDSRSNQFLSELGEVEREYWRNTGLVPPYNPIYTSITDPFPSPSGGYVFRPGAGTHQGHYADVSGPMRYFIDAQGGGNTTEHIGWWPNWCAMDFNMQTPAMRKKARILALDAARITQMVVLDEATSTGDARIPVLNNSIYSGMGAARPTPGWFSATIRTTDVPSPIGYGGGSILMASYRGDFDSTHRPSNWMWPWLIEGGRHFLHMIWRSANKSLFARPGNSSYPRQRSVGGTTYNGVIAQYQGNIRADGWATREIGFAAAMGGDSPEKTYFTDVLGANFDYLLALRGTQASEYQIYGWYNTSTVSEVSTFMINFIFGSYCWAYILNRDPDMKTFLDHMKINQIGLWDGSFGGSSFYGPSQSISQRISQGGTYCNWSQVGPILINCVRATNGTVTYPAGVTGTIADGDRISPIAYFGGSAGLIPPELSDPTYYYIRDLNTTTRTFKLSATSGGAAITYASPGTTHFIWVPTTGPATGVKEPNYQDSYTRVARDAVLWGKFAGLAGMDGTVTAAKYRETFCNSPHTTHMEYSLDDTGVSIP